MQTSNFATVFILYGLMVLPTLFDEELNYSELSSRRFPTFVVMILQNLSVLNFKNIAQLDVDFSRHVNCFLGDNGEGKTNLLDAIYYMAFTKSYFTAQDSNIVRFQERFFMLQGIFELENEEINIHCGVKVGEKKKIKKNKKMYAKLADHIGLLPVVIVTPNDISLVTDGSEGRRKFLDSLISQFDKSYLQDLITYNRYTAQKSALLKQFQERGSMQIDLLDVLDAQILAPGERIFKRRKTFLEEFVTVFNTYYQDISSSKERVSLVYQSQVFEFGFQKMLQLHRSKDLKSTYNTSGIHKDDLIFNIADKPLKRFGSQGQQKTFLIALKLATFEIIKKQKGFAPILLLDDIFDKLDDKRINYLLSQIAKGNLGQTFITDTSTTKVPEMLTDLDIEFEAFQIEDGAIKNHTKV